MTATPIHADDVLTALDALVVEFGADFYTDRSYVDEPTGLPCCLVACTFDRVGLDFRQLVENDPLSSQPAEVREQLDDDALAVLDAAQEAHDCDGATWGEAVDVAHERYHELREATR